MTCMGLLNQVVNALHQLPNQDIGHSCFAKSYELASHIKELPKNSDAQYVKKGFRVMLPSNIKTTCTICTQCYGAHRCSCPTQQTLGKPHPLAMARTNLTAHDDKPIKPEVITL